MGVSLRAVRNEIREYGLPLGGHHALHECRAIRAALAISRRQRHALGHGHHQPRTTRYNPGSYNTSRRCGLAAMFLGYRMAGGCWWRE